MSTKKYLDGEGISKLRELMSETYDEYGAAAAVQDNLDELATTPPMYCELNTQVSIPVTTHPSTSDDSGVVTKLFSAYQLDENSEDCFELVPGENNTYGGIKIKQAGLYYITAFSRIDAENNNYDYSLMYIYKNGTTALSYRNPKVSASAAYGFISASLPVFAAAGDVFTVADGAHGSSWGHISSLSGANKLCIFKVR